MTLPVKSKKPWTIGEKAILATTSVVLTVLVIGVLVVANLETTPDVQIPTPRTPSPNAYDAYEVASDPIVDSGKVGYALSGPGNRSTHSRPSNPLEREYTPAEEAALVAENVSALTMVSRALGEPCAAPASRSFTTLTPYLGKMRSLARLIALDAKVKANQRDYPGAMRASIDGIQFGTDVQRGAMLDSLVGNACVAIARRRVWPWIAHLSAAEARADARRLFQIDATRVTVSDVAREDEYATEASLLEVMQQPNWRQSLVGVANPDGDSDQTARVTLPMYLTSKKRVMSEYTGFMDSYIAHQSAHPEDWNWSPPVSTSPLVNSVLPAVAHYAYLPTRESAEIRLLAVTVALQAYHADHHAYPDSLAALVPADLPSIPTDPFDGHPVRYRRTASGYVLYSVGPDGKDDGGKPILDATQPKPSRPSEYDTRTNPHPNSVGDIVAGVNY